MQLDQIALNLIVNARDAIKDNGFIKLSIKGVTACEKDDSDTKKPEITVSAPQDHEVLIAGLLSQPLIVKIVFHNINSIWYIHEQSLNSKMM